MIPFNPFQFIYDFGIGFLKFMQYLWEFMQTEIINIGGVSITVFALVTYQVGGLVLALIVARLVVAIIALNK